MADLHPWRATLATCVAAAKERPHPFRAREVDFLLSLDRLPEHSIPSQRRLDRLHTLALRAAPKQESCHGQREVP